MRGAVGALVCLILCAALVRAAEVVVSCATSCSFNNDIRPVVLAAAQTGDTVIVSGGPYLGPCTPIAWNQTTGPVNITGVGGVVINCAGTGPLLSANRTGGNLTISGFNISNCGFGTLGGCIEASYTTLNLADMFFNKTGTAVAFLGVARNQNAALLRCSLSVVRCSFLNNTASSNLDPSLTMSGGGVAVFNAYRMLLRDSLFRGCSAADDGASVAMRSDSINPIVAEFYTSTFLDGFALSSSAGIFVRSGRQDFNDAITVSGCTFLRGVSSSGTGVWFQTAYGKMTLTASVFRFQVGNYGASVREFGGIVTVANCVFDSAVSLEGAVSLESNGNLPVNSTITNCTFTNNSASTCGILAMDGTGLRMDLVTFENNFSPLHLINLPGASNWTRVRYVNNVGTNNVQISFQPLVTSLFMDSCVFANNIGPLVNHIMGSGAVTRVTNTLFSNNTSGSGLFNAYRVVTFDLTNPGVVFFTNVTFINNNNFNGSVGAALAVKDINIRITNGVFVNNTGRAGGGLYTEGANAIVEVINSTFIGNSARSGGGYYDASVLRANFTDSLFDSNTAQQGGGIYLNPSLYANTTRFDCNRCTLRNNVATTFGGGGISNAYYAKPAFYDSLFESNTATLGGAVHVLLNNNSNSNASVALVRCTLRYNSASSGGGAIALVNGGSAMLVQSTVVYNYASSSLGTAINCNQRPLTPLTATQTSITHHQYAAVVGCDLPAPGIYPGYSTPPCGTCDYGDVDLPTGTCNCSSPDIPGPNCTFGGSACGVNGCTWFVNAISGADLYNNGTTPGSAFATLTKAQQYSSKGDRIYIIGSIVPVNVTKAITIAAYGAAVIACDGLAWGLGYTSSPTEGPRLEGLYIRGCQMVVTTGTVTISGGILGGNPYGPLLTFNGASVMLVNLAWGGDGSLVKPALTISGVDGNLTLVNVTAPPDGTHRSVDVTRVGLNVTDSMFTGVVGESLFSTTLGAASFTRMRIEGNCFVGDCSSPMRCVALVLRGDASLVDCTIQNNVGAAVAVSGAGVSVTMDRTSIFNHTDANYGGAGLRVSNGAAVALHATAIRRISSPPAAFGGAVSCTSNGVLDVSQGCEIGDSCAGFGGGLSLSGCTASIRDSSVRNSVGVVQGGGIHSMSTVLVMTNVTIEGNSAGQLNGGGMFVNTTTAVSLDGVRFLGNAAPAGQGGGLSAQRITITNSLFSQNAALAGGAVAATERLVVFNTVINDNSAVGASCMSYVAGGIYLSGGTLHQAANLTMARNRGGMGAAWLMQTADIVNVPVAAQLNNVSVSGSGCGAAVAVVGSGAALTWQGGDVSTTNGVGGGFYLTQGAQATITGTTIRGNNASSTLLNAAGGITCFGCTLTLDHALLENNTAGAGLLGAGFGCKASGAIAATLNLDTATTIFRGNYDVSYPGLEANFFGCGGCNLRAALALNPYARMTVDAISGAGCTPYDDASTCPYACNPPLVLAVAPSFACTQLGISPTVACLLPNTCPLLVPGPGQLIVQPNPPGNGSLAIFSCSNPGFVLSNNQPMVCNPPNWVGTPPTCDPIPTTSTTSTSTTSTTGTPSVDASTPPAPAASDPTIAIVAAILGVAVVLGAIIIGFCIVRRNNMNRRHQQRRGTTSDVTVKADGLSMAELIKDMLTNATVIAEGGSGTVYKAKYEGSVVALKVFKQQSDAARRDYHREVKAFTLFSQGVAVAPAVISLKFIAEFAIAMEYVEGVSLYDLIQKEGRNLHDGKRMDIIEQLADVLEYFEDKHLAHLDVKTRNILVQKGTIVKLIDYGLTQITTDAHPLEELTGFTPQFVAPEIASIAHSLQRNSALQSDVIDLHAADVFSFAIVLWSICAVDEPYKGLSGTEVYAALINDPDKRPVLPDNAHGHWADIVRACWHTDPRKRPTFAEIAVSLGQCRESCFDGTPSRRSRPLATVPRNRADIVRATPRAFSTDTNRGSSMMAESGAHMAVNPVFDNTLATAVSGGTDDSPNSSGRGSEAPMASFNTVSTNIDLGTNRSQGMESTGTLLQTVVPPAPSHAPAHGDGGSSSSSA